ncbi:MAG: hypothetical protein HY318_01015 [Armatimonadetes bacterium]|nr:hypothetical protein [Armatimonadota bacterium]
MKAGFCTTDITPALGMEGPGGYGKVYIQQIHDPLKVRAAVVDDGSNRVAMVGLDTLIIGRESVEEIRSTVRERCGIPEDHILIAASHTHSGGPLFGPLPDEIRQMPQPVQDLLLYHSTIADPLYREWVVKQTVTAICEADRKKEEVTLSVGSGHEDQVAFNRRFKMKNGRAVTHPGKGNPHIVEPAGPIDPEVGVLGAWRADGTLLGCIVNYSCHCTTFGGGVSADWVCYLVQTIQGVLGEQATVVFLNGACGDVTQVNNRSLKVPEFGEVSSRFVGTRVGAEAVKVLLTADKGELAPVTAKNQVLTFKRRIPSQTRVEKCRQVVEEGLKTGNRDTEWTFAKEILILDHFAKAKPEVEVEVQALQIGAAVYLSNPAEYFCQLGLDIKAGSPFPFTYVVELANGVVGYVCTEEALNPDGGGGYETLMTSYSSLEVSAGTRIAEACVDLAKQLTPGQVPKRQETEPSDDEWSYGILGPELE